MDEEDVKDRLRAKEVAEGSCVHLVRAKDEWLEKWGTEEGKKAWLAQDAQYRDPGPKAVKASKAAYRRLKLGAEKHHAIFGFACSEGLPFRATREIVGPFFHESYTAAFCDMQANCKSYRSVDQALVDLAKHPMGSA